MRKSLLVVLLASFSLVALAATESLKSYSAKEAAKHVGESALVTGKVDGVRTLDSGMTLVNLDGRYPDQACTVVVRAEHAKAVGDLAELEGKNITVRGTITEYKGKPQVEITTRDAIAEVAK